jgi:sugar phosphate isomerase/epimerase
LKVGCNTVVFAGVDLGTALEHVALAGYENVELAAIRGMCEHVNPDLGKDHVSEVRGLLEGSGLTATAMEVASPDRERLEGIFWLAGELEIEIVNIGSGGESRDEESTKRSIANIAQLAALAGESGLRLAVKPHVGQAIYNGDTALRLTDEVDELALGLNFDPSHLFRAEEEPQEIARRWGDRIVTSHFRDCASREQAVGPPENQIPGRGLVDIPATLRALQETGYDGPLNLEIIGAFDYPLARAMGVAAESRGYLRCCLQEIMQ